MQPELALADFGFTELEARLYCELLRASPATGYRLAQRVGKAPANVYQALSAMHQKGIVFSDDGEARQYRPLPPGELMVELQQDFEQRRGAAQAALNGVYSRPDRDRIYQFNGARQAVERARTVVGGAREMVLFDLFPGPFERLRPALEAAAASGVTVAGVTYGAAPSAPFTCVESAGAGVRDQWPGAQLTVIADAREYVMALLSADGEQLIHGVWSESPYLACLEHAGLSSEIRLSAVTRGDDPLAHLGLLRAAPRGLLELQNSVRDPAKSAEAQPQALG
jgi:hypothetical protein